MTWTAHPGGPLDCEHSGVAGRVDESARRLSHEELFVATRLAAEGHDVASYAELPGNGRTADMRACGVDVEVKSWLGLGEGRDRPPTSSSVANKLLSADGQAGVVVLNGVRAGLTPAVARAGMAEFAAHSHRTSVERVRVVGADFDLTWRRERAVDLVRRAEPLRLGSGL